MYSQHDYNYDHIWNYNEIGIQVGKQSRAKILAKKGYNAIYNNIPKSQEWLTINCAFNVARVVLLSFYIFRGENLRDTYIKFYKLRIYMAMQKNLDDHFYV